jgi:hypothetical protein
MTKSTAVQRLHRTCPSAANGSSFTGRHRTPPRPESCLPPRICPLQTGPSCQPASTQRPVCTCTRLVPRQFPRQGLELAISSPRRPLSPSTRNRYLRSLFIFLAILSFISHLDGATRHPDRPTPGTGSADQPRTAAGRRAAASRPVPILPAHLAPHARLPETSSTVTTP